MYGTRQLMNTQLYTYTIEKDICSGLHTIRCDSIIIQLVSRVTAADETSNSVGTAVVTSSIISPTLIDV